MAEFVANGHVRITGAKLTKEIVAPNTKKAARMGQDWAHDNDLVYDGVETAAEWLARDIRESKPEAAPSVPRIETVVEWEPTPPGYGTRSITVALALDGSSAVLVCEDNSSAVALELDDERIIELKAALTPKLVVDKNDPVTGPNWTMSVEQTDSGRFNLFATEGAGFVLSGNLDLDQLEALHEQATDILRHRGRL